MRLDDAPAAGAGEWHTLAHGALLDHVNRGDARHALQLLLTALAQQLGQPCQLLAQHADGSARWRLASESPLADAAVDGAAKAAKPSANAPSSALNLPLVRLGQHVGVLQLQRPAAEHLGPPGGRSASIRC